MFLTLICIVIDLFMISNLFTTLDIICLTFLHSWKELNNLKSCYKKSTINNFLKTSGSP